MKASTAAYYDSVVVSYSYKLGSNCCHFLPPGVNFTNILQAAFSYESFLPHFYELTILFVISWQKDFGTKAAHKMLAKLPPGGSMGPTDVLQVLFSEKLHYWL
jgi:hypothetical protein